MQANVGQGKGGKKARRDSDIRSTPSKQVSEGNL